MPVKLRTWGQEGSKSNLQGGQDRVFLLITRKLAPRPLLCNPKAELLTLICNAERGGGIKLYENLLYSTSLKQATRKCDIQFLEKGKHNSN